MRPLELIERIRSGDSAREAQEELYLRVEEALLDRLRRKIPSRLKSRLDAEDVLHTAFLRALGALDDFQATTDGSFFAWVYIIAKNLITDTSRRRSVIALSFSRGEEEKGPRESQIASRARRVSTTFARREWVETLLGGLREKEAEVIRLHLIRGLSFKEIAESWSKTPGGVQRLYSRSCQRLRELAQRRRTDSGGASTPQD